MNQQIVSLITSDFIIICLACFAISQFIKSFLKARLGKDFGGRLELKNAIVPSIPVFVGAIVSCLYFGLYGLPTVFLGVAAGILSGYIFGATKAVIRAAGARQSDKDMEDK